MAVKKCDFKIGEGIVIYELFFINWFNSSPERKFVLLSNGNNLTFIHMGKHRIYPEQTNDSIARCYVRALVSGFVQLQ